MVKTLIVVIIAFAAGIVGFAQILWSMKKVKQRGMALTIATSVVWALIMVGVGALVNHYLPGQMQALVITYAVAFVILFVAQLLQQKAQ